MKYYPKPRRVKLNIVHIYNVVQCLKPPTSSRNSEHTTYKADFQSNIIFDKYTHISVKIYECTCICTHFISAKRYNEKLYHVFISYMK